MRKPRAWGWWRYTTAKQARRLSIGYACLALMILFTGLTTQAGGGYAVVALIPASGAATWGLQWRRAKAGNAPKAEVSATPATSNSRASQLYKLILASPRNATIYGLVVGLLAALFVIATFGVLSATAGANSRMLLPALAVVLLMGPAGGILAYYFGPHSFRGQGTK